MTVCNLLFFRILPALVLLVAVFVGWLSTNEIPMGTLFATVFPLSKGYLPPSIFGPFATPGTVAVPDDLQAAPRPAGEMFVALPDGSQMPANGIGMCCRPGAYDDETVRRTVLWYLLQGGRMVDTAHLYLNHKPIGAAIKEAIQRGVPRSEIFVVTKVWPSTFGYNSTTALIPQFMSELGLEYLDLVLLHMPRFPIPIFGMSPECKASKYASHKECRQATWRALSDAVAAGTVRSAGVSNFNVRQMQELSELGLAPVANNQLQFNPWAPEWAHEAVDYCKKNGIAVTAWSSLAGTMMQTAKALTVDTLQGIAKALGNVTVAQVLLRWSLQKGLIIIPGTSNPKHMRENLAAYDLVLSDADMAAIDALGSDTAAREFMYGPQDDS